MLFRIFSRVFYVKLISLLLILFSSLSFSAEHSITGSWASSVIGNVHSTSNPNFQFTVKDLQEVNFSISANFTLNSFSQGLHAYILNDKSVVIKEMQARSNLNLSIDLPQGEYSLVVSTLVPGDRGTFTVITPDLDMLIAKPLLVVESNWESSAGQDPYSIRNPQYSFSIPETKVVHFEVKAKFPYYNRNGHGLHVYILDDTGSIVKEPAAGASPQSVTVERHFSVELLPGEYTFVMGTNKPGGNGAFSIATYDIENEFITQLPSKTVGSWSSSAGQTPFSENNPTFWFELTEATELSIRVYNRFQTPSWGNPNSSGSYLYLLTPHGEILAEQLMTDGHFFTFQALPGEYYLAVGTDKEFSRGSFTLETFSLAGGSFEKLDIDPPSCINLPARELPGQSFDINWCGVSNATSYKLYENNTLFSEHTETTVQKVNVEGKYEYELRACNSSVCGFHSEKSTILVFPPAPEVPVVKTEKKGNHFDVTWNNVANADQYRLEVQFENGDWEYVGTYEGNIQSASFSDLNVGNYKYRIVACQGDNCAEPSSVTEQSSIDLIHKPGRHTLTAWTTNSGKIRLSINPHPSFGTISLFYRNKYSLGNVSGVIENIHYGNYQWVVADQLPGGYYSLASKMCNFNGCSQLSYYVNAVQRPDPVTNILVQVNGQNISFNWQQHDTGQLNTVEYSYEGGQYQPYSGTKQQTFTTPNLPAGSYKFKVSSCLEDCSYSEETNTIEFLPTPVTITSDNVRLEKIKNRLAFTWKESNAVQEYIVELQHNDGAWQPFPAINSTAANLTVHDVQQTGDYRFRVKPCNVSGCNNFTESNTVIVDDIPDNNLARLSFPYQVGSPEDGAMALQVSWPDLSDNSFYTIESNVTGQWQTIYQGENASYEDRSLWYESYAFQYRLTKCTNEDMLTCEVPTLLDFTYSPIVDFPMLQAIQRPVLSKLSELYHKSGWAFDLSWSSIKPTSYRVYSTEDKSLTNGPVTDSWALDVFGGLDEVMPVIEYRFRSVYYRIFACDIYGICQNIPQSITVNVPFAPENVIPQKDERGAVVTWSPLFDLDCFAVSRDIYLPGESNPFSTGVWGSGRFVDSWSIETADPSTWIVKVGSMLRDEAGKCDFTTTTYGEEFSIEFDTTIIRPPSTFKFEKDGSGGYQFVWSIGFGALGYKIERSTDEQLTWQDVGYYQAISQDRTYTPVLNPPPGNNIYRIRSCKSESDCALLSKTAKGIYIGVLPQPTNVSANIVNERIYVNWSRPDNEFLTGFSVGYIDDSGTNWIWGATLSASTISNDFVLQQIKPQADGKYYVFVKAIFEVNGSKQYSEPSVVILSDVTPPIEYEWSKSPVNIGEQVQLTNLDSAISYCVSTDDSNLRFDNTSQIVFYAVTTGEVTNWQCYDATDVLVSNIVAGITVNKLSAPQNLMSEQ
ncbi:fibronectin type III domain-containing protein [Paraglaciecola arctica]|uniref:Fibronectin type-III domain-containing protein n=1 Tax=Paraglaciecola arctica BSs20135 TaxID=493475 RepID=K6XG03_9ALTE|nr:hypothetical protein [Paraglaciecola arctica]GAC19584.1 hypothetical protein GARC_2618 [Paraglaciecola arctica BSs20135]